MPAITHWSSYEPVTEKHWGEGHQAAYAAYVKCDLNFVEPALISSHSQVSADLSQALKSLYEIEADALSMGHEVPGKDVVKDTERILRKIYQYLPRQYDVSSMSKGRIGIDVDGGFGRSLLLVCEPGGNALCVVTIDQVSRRARYEDSRFLPDDFVKEALRQMGRV